MDLDQLTQFRKELHQHPEIAHQEENTAARIVSFLEGTKPDELITNIGGHGVVARYNGTKSGKKILFRAELDALPIQEVNTFTHKSKNKGISHKCGHDGHLTILCGLAIELTKKDFAGEVFLLFQPAEEVGEGAKLMLEDQKIKNIRPDFAFALHNLPQFPRGEIVLKDGIFAAASTGVIIKLRGKPSHASHPKDGRNPIFALNQISQVLFELPQMHTKLEEAFQITPVGMKAGQKAFGTSAATGEIYATLRTFEDNTLLKICDLLEKKSSLIAEANELEIQIEYLEGFSAVVNNTFATQMAENAAKELNYSVLKVNDPFPWSEDFGAFSKLSPLCLFGLGAGKDHAQLHNEDYDFPDEITEKGISIFKEIIHQINL